MEAEHDRGAAGRFGPGTPRISDGQLLFLLHMLAHMRKLEAGGSRVAIIMNGSPLFTGDAGSGESEIRRYVLENDWLEALIALPEQLFYNTGIATYIWVLTNHKAPERKGLVQLIDATATEESIRFWQPMRKSLGDKRREIPFEKASEILDLLRAFEDGAVRRIPAPGQDGRVNGDGDGDEGGGETRDVVVSKVFPTTHFGFRKITVERPLRLDFQASPERIARLEDERAFANLATSKKRKGPAKEKEEAEGRAQQEAIRALLGTLPGRLFTDRATFEKALDEAARAADVKLSAPAKKAILSALSERNEQAEICRDKDGNAEPDPELRDTESVPLAEPIEVFFEREVRPHVPDAWIDTARRDPKDGEVGLVGYEINFNRYFYEYRPPRPLEKIEADIQAIEKDIVAMLREVAG